MLEEVSIRKLRFLAFRETSEMCKKEVDDVKLAYDQIVDSLHSIQTSYDHVKRHFANIGYWLNYIKETELYSVVRRSEFSEYPRYLKTSFTDFCKDYFGFSESTTYSFIQVYKCFCYSNGVVKEDYANYNFSQLVEMTSLAGIVSFTEVSPEMTVREIRSLKKKAKADKKEEKQEIVSSPDEDKKEPGKAQKVFPDLTSKKDEFRKLVKSLFETYKYELKLNNRGQGGFAFGGSLFDYLDSKGFFDA